MALFDFLKREKPPAKQRMVKFMEGFSDVLPSGYTTLDRNPEVVAGCFKIAQLISSMTIYLMANTQKGDVRVINELSRKIDIEPSKTMTRSSWMTSVIMNLLLYGNGNSVIFPHTKNGILEDLEPIKASRVSFREVVGRNDYRIVIDGTAYDPQDLIHLVFNPDPNYLWKGAGFQVALSSVVDNLAQAAATKKGFMSSKWKPSLIVKVDALTEELSSKEGRERLMNDYLTTGSAGKPWFIPAEQLSVEQVRPLSLADLAINETVQIDKKTVAAILGVPAYVLGVGEFHQAEWNAFISNTIRPIAQSIEQELTKKLILSPKMYLMFNVSKLYSYDLAQLSEVYSSLYDKGIVCGNEVREKLGMQPKEGLDKLLVLENYIPVEKAGDQKKLKGDS